MATAPELTERFARQALPVVYDTFSEACSDLRGAYARAQRLASSPAEVELWLDRAKALRKFRSAINGNDRQALVESIVMLADERRQVLSHVANRSATAAA